MDFLHNAWYVAAWSDEIGRTFLSRRVLNIPVVLYRKSNGSPAALVDQCPHRYAPLSGGVLIDNAVECPYHGLRFEPSGVCSFNPQGKIPSAARVRSFPVVDKDSLLWIWMGDPELADESTIIDCSFITKPHERRTIKGTTYVKANYALIIDNLMDLSHSQFIHADSFGTDALMKANYEVHEDKGVVSSNRWYESGPALPLLERFLPTGGQPVEHWVNIYWHSASNLILDLGMTISGRPRDAGWTALSPNLLTPETQSTTHYFFAYSRNMYLDSDVVDEQLGAALGRAFNEQDAPMLETIQIQFGGDYDKAPAVPVLLAGDTGSVRARRLLQERIDQERAAGQAPRV